MEQAEGFPLGAEGTSWCLVDSQWWAMWREYARFSSALSVRESRQRAAASARALFAVGWLLVPRTLRPSRPERRSGVHVCSAVD